MENSTVTVTALVCQSLIISHVPLPKFHIPCSALSCNDKAEETCMRAKLNFPKQRQGPKLTPVHPHGGPGTDWSLYTHGNPQGVPVISSHHCCFTSLPEETETKSNACLKSHSKLAPRSIPLPCSLKHSVCFLSV